MISQNELRRIAGRMGLGVGQAEVEYVILCALDALSQTELLADAFCLKGGTALRQLYFADWRHSVDIDFSVLPVFRREMLTEGLNAWFGQLGRLHGIEASLKDFHQANGAVRLRARFVGPLNHPSRLLLDLTFDEPVLLPPERRQIITGLFEQPQPAVLCYALEEILAEKLRSVLQRGKARDYYDVWRLLGEKTAYFSTSTTRRVFFEKCAIKGMADPSLEMFLTPPLLESAAAFWSRDLMGQIADDDLPAWNSVVMELEALLVDLLA